MPAHRFQSDQVASHANWAAGSTADDFGTAGIKADVIAESTAATGVTIDGVLAKDGALGSASDKVEGITGNGFVANVVGIGYTTGAGGAVTQLTSKSTGVTLSTACGSITMHNESLAGGAEASFVVTNTQVAATDVIAVCCKTLGSGGTGTYIPAVTLVGAGSFTITVANVGATAGEAVVLNFAVIKSVAA